MFGIQHAPRQGWSAPFIVDLGTKVREALINAPWDRGRALTGNPIAGCFGRAPSALDWPPMNLLLIDDHPVFAIGLSYALRQVRPGMNMRVVRTLTEGLKEARLQGAIDVVLIDYRLEDEDGLNGLRKFGEAFPHMARVLISGHDEPTLSARARAAGASAFIAKSFSMSELLATLDAVRRGATVFSDQIDEPLALDDVQLTTRQREVLCLLAQGYRNKQIAFELGITERTVKTHVTALFQAMGAQSRTQVLIKGRQLGCL